MRRRVLFVVAWALATVLTVGASWLGIRSVLSAAAPGHALPLSAAELRRVAPTSAAPESPLPPLSPAAPPARSDGPSLADSPTPAAPVSPSAKPAPSVVDVWQSVPDGRGGTAFRRTFHTSGGDVVVLAAKNDVKIVSSTPKPGFAVNTSRAAADAVTVTFSAPRRVCRVAARWMNGPYAEVGEVAGYGP